MSVAAAGAGYRAAEGYDEFVDPSGEVRPAWREFADLIAERGGDGLTRLGEVVRGLVDNDGITTGGQTWKLDGIPLPVSLTETTA